MPTQEEVASMPVGSGTLREFGLSLYREPSEFMGLGNYAPEWSQDGCRSSDVGQVLDRVVCTHWGVWPDAAKIESTIRDGVAVAVDYFYGAYTKQERYRDRFSRSPDNCNLSWSAVWRDGCLLCLLIRDDTDSMRLAEWVTPNLPYDSSEYDFSEAENSFLKLLAQHLCSRDDEGDEKHRLQQAITNGRTKKPKLLLEVLHAIEQQDQILFLKTLGAYMKHYLKREFAKLLFTEFIAVEGSILAALGKRQGLTLDGLDEELKSTIVTRESLGLEG